MNDKFGFTLVELLVSVAIVGILTSVAIPAFDNYRKKAFDSSALQTLRHIQKAAHATIAEIEANCIDCAHSSDGTGGISRYQCNFGGGEVVCSTSNIKDQMLEDLISGMKNNQDIYWGVTIRRVSGLLGLSAPTITVNAYAEPCRGLSSFSWNYVERADLIIGNPIDIRVVDSLDSDKAAVGCPGY